MAEPLDAVTQVPADASEAVSLGYTFVGKVLPYVTSSTVVCAVVMMQRQTRKKHCLHITPDGLNSRYGFKRGRLLIQPIVIFRSHIRPKGLC